jgi:hypothetical protein
MHNITVCSKVIHQSHVMPEGNTEFGSLGTFGNMRFPLEGGDWYIRLVPIEVCGQGQEIRYV